MVQYGMRMWRKPNGKVITSMNFNHHNISRQPLFTHPLVVPQQFNHDANTIANYTIGIDQRIISTTLYVITQCINQHVPRKQ